MHDLKYLSQEEQKAYENEFGGHNDFPPFWREITEEQFAESMLFHYYPTAFDTRQMCRPKRHMTENVMIGAKLFFFHDHTGVAIESYREQTRYDQPNKPARIRYYAFGCDHKYREMSMSECQAEGITHHGHAWHVLKCEHCGQTKAHDSSD